MNLQQQVTNLELAKKLKELGCKQDSLFNWYRITPDKEWALTSPNHVTFIYNGTEWFSAFTVAELGEMLPSTISIGGLVQTWKLNQPKDWYQCAITGHYGLQEHNGNQLYFEAHTEADARALCLIYLIENGLYDVQQSTHKD